MKLLAMGVRVIAVAVLLSCAMRAQTQDAPKCELSSVGRIPACQFIWTQPNPLVFMGVAKRVEIVTRKNDVTRRTVVTFSVTEQFLGAPTKEVSVYTGGDECGGFLFSEGELYLVYAHIHQGEPLPYAYEASFKRLFDGDRAPEWEPEAKEDLLYLRSLSTRPNEGEIYGAGYKFTAPDPNRLGKEHLVRQIAAASLQVIKVDGPRSYTVTVNREGKFRVQGVVPGEYTVTLRPDGLPKGTYNLVSESGGEFERREQFKINIAPKGCVQIDFRIDPFGPDTRSHK